MGTWSLQPSHKYGASSTALFPLRYVMCSVLHVSNLRLCEKWVRRTVPWTRHDWRARSPSLLSYRCFDKYLLYLAKCLSLFFFFNAIVTFPTAQACWEDNTLCRGINVQTLWWFRIDLGIDQWQWNLLNNLCLKAKSVLPNDLVLSCWVTKRLW